MSKPTLYDEHTIDELVWPDTPDGQYAKNYLLPMVKHTTTAYIKNVKTKLYILSLDHLILPVTVNDEDYENSYVCSPYTHYVSYAIEELRELKNPLVEAVLKVPISILGWCLKRSKVNKVVCVNNWMLSTNLYPEINKTQLEDMTKLLSERFKGYTIMFRSLNDLTTKTILESLEAQGYLKIASRRSYISDTLIPLKSRAKSIVNKDLKLLSARMMWKEGSDLSSAERQRILDLYNQLYLDKYSMWNPQFTMSYIDEMIQNRILECHVLLIDGEIQGVVGFFIRNNVMTTPFFGYNLELPIEIGLYRMLSSKLLAEASVRMLILHQSSGAGEFKKSRGAQPIVEYSLVMPSKNGIGNKLGWLVIKKLTNDVAMPIIIRKGL